MFAYLLRKRSDTKASIRQLHNCQMSNISLSAIFANVIFAKCSYWQMSFQATKSLLVIFEKMYIFKDNCVLLVNY